MSASPVRRSRGTWREVFFDDVVEVRVLSAPPSRAGPSVGPWCRSLDQSASSLRWASCESQRVAAARHTERAHPPNHRQHEELRSQSPAGLVSAPAVRVSSYSGHEGLELAARHTMLPSEIPRCHLARGAAGVTHQSDPQPLCVFPSSHVGNFVHWTQSTHLVAVRSCLDGRGEDPGGSWAAIPFQRNRLLFPWF